jgi:hypothetical protein
MTTGELPYADSSSTVTTPAGSGANALAWDSTNYRLGVGTTAPANSLDVAGGAAFGSYAGTAAPSNDVIVGGSVGIGTTNPSSRLTVNGVIESKVGGVKFPDGTTQTTAAPGALSTPPQRD